MSERALAVAHVGGNATDADRDRWLAARLWLERADPCLAEHLERARVAGTLRHDAIDLNAIPARDFLRERTRYEIVVTHDLWGFPELRREHAGGPAAASELHTPAAWRARLRLSAARYIFMFGPHFNPANLGGRLAGYRRENVESAPPLCVFAAHDRRATATRRTRQVIGYHDMTRARLERLSELSENRALDLSYTALGPAHVALLAAMPRLSELRLVGTAIDGEQLALLAARRSLETLVLDETQLGEAGLSHVARLENLLRLSLNRTAIGDASLTALSQLKHVAWLSLCATPIGDRGLCNLHAVSSLRYVSLARTRASARGVAALQRALPACEICYEPAA